MCHIYPPRVVQSLLERQGVKLSAAHSVLSQLETWARGPAGVAARLEAAAPVQHGRFEPFTLQLPRMPPSPLCLTAAQGEAPHPAPGGAHADITSQQQQPAGRRPAAATPSRLARAPLTEPPDHAHSTAHHAPPQQAEGTCPAPQRMAGARGSTPAIQPPLTPAPKRRPRHRPLQRTPLPAFGSPFGVLASLPPPPSRWSLSAHASLFSPPAGRHCAAMVGGMAVQSHAQKKKIGLHADRTAGATA